MNVHTFKRQFKYEPTTETNEAFLSWLLDRVQSIGETKTTALAALKIFKQCDLDCQEYAQAQDWLRGTDQIPYESELLHPFAFRGLLPSIFPDERNLIDAFSDLGWGDLSQMEGVDFRAIPNT
jgi:hypothetical protein